MNQVKLQKIKDFKESYAAKHEASKLFLVDFKVKKMLYVFDVEDDKIDEYVNAWLASPYVTNRRF